MMTMTHRATTRRGSHRLGRNGLSTIRRCLRIAGSLLNAACRSLGGSSRLLCLLAGGLSARGCLVGTIGGIHRTLRRIGRIRAASHQRKG
jgi:hypothetical protein